jgi:RNA-directed DNA polymerase
MDEGRGFQLPVGATIDEELLATVSTFQSKLSLYALRRVLDRHASSRSYDAARLLAQELFLTHLGSLSGQELWSLQSFTERYLDPGAQLQVAHQLSRDRNLKLRRWAIAKLEQEGALGAEAWDWARWADRTRPGRLLRHEHGAPIQKSNNIAVLETVGALRQALGVASTAQLGWMLLASTSGLADAGIGPYHTFHIPKATGGLREIAAPRPQLKRVQRAILSQILSRLPVHAAAHGFVPGRSTVTNAAEHVGRDIIIKFDLKDFFPSISYWRVLGLYAQLGYSPGSLRINTSDDSRAVAPILARLSVYAPDPGAYGSGHTPQGAPTSPAICNLVCRGLDARLHGLAQAIGGSYTRYADDLTFSFDGEPPVGRLRWWVQEICRQEGFTVNHKKFRVIRRSQRQQVTGVVVNDKLTVPRRARRRFRAILHNCRTHGLASQARGRPDFPAYLRGFASYVHMVQPIEGRLLLDEVEALLDGAEEPGA